MAAVSSAAVGAAPPRLFYEPTVVAGLTDGSRLVDEEPFGPIVPVIAYRDLDEVIARANANPQGLGGSVWSADVRRATAIALRLECGTVWVTSTAPSSRMRLSAASSSPASASSSVPTGWPEHGDPDGEGDEERSGGGIAIIRAG